VEVTATYGSTVVLATTIQCHIGLEMQCTVCAIRYLMIYSQLLVATCMEDRSCVYYKFTMSVTVVAGNFNGYKFVK